MTVKTSLALKHTSIIRSTLFRKPGTGHPNANPNFAQLELFKVSRE